ncbi:alanine racemase [Desulforudis sp. DRI-14]|uniref:alanine racemase n=1 Tax=Desulforudis sp. DRI-14 TaxID=3459793 RepID=UPI00404350C7
MKVYELDTPAVLVDVDLLKANIEGMAQETARLGIKLRPHAKTHKSPEIAAMQLDAGACGITVAKLSEAEIMAGYGVDDILVAYPLVGPAKLTRLKDLVRKTKVTVSVDSAAVARGIAEVGETIAVPVPVCVEVNTGQNRCGLEPGRATVEFVKSLAALPGIKVTGLMTHAGHAYQARNLNELRQIARGEAFLLADTCELLRKAGLPVDEISVGSTPTARFMAEMDGVTEIRPGTYVFNDYNMVCLGVAEVHQCALTVLSTVVSRPAGNRFVLDAGSKTLSSDPSVRGRGYGFIKGCDCTVTRLSEEHGVVEAEVEVVIGDRVEIIPNHCCPVVNLTDSLYLRKGQEIVGELKVRARGMNR